MIKSNNESRLKLHGKTSCLIVDSEYLKFWQYQALAKAIADGLLVTHVLLCTNTRYPRKFFHNLFYYVLIFFSTRHKWNKKIKWRKLVSADVQVQEFESLWTGTWQSIPENLFNTLAKKKFDFVIKFGMYLLRDPQKIPSEYGVFSYHHGDPSSYRGRPAGFYEILNKESYMGVMVQRLSNYLDAGQVFSFGSCKIYGYSYKKTLENSYSNGVYLLTKALKNAVTNTALNISTNGKNYRLPENIVVLKFILALVYAKFKRLLYALYIEKKWRVCVVDTIPLDMSANFAKVYPAQPVHHSKKYSFLADPFSYDESTFFCEAMCVKSARGIIVAITPNGIKEIDMSGFGYGHFSYPFIVNAGKNKYLLPEMSSVSSQKIGIINEDLSISQIVPLQGLEGARLKDPTLFFRDNKWWLFAGKSGASPDLLFLWFSEAIIGPYSEHPDNPIVICPSRARPAGPILFINGVTFRFGQINSMSYGNGITVAEILQLNEFEYRESATTRIAAESNCGPHTICPHGEKYLIDFYQEYKSFNAFFFRLKILLAHVL